MTKHTYRQRVLDAMPGTRRAIEDATGLAKNTVWRWVEDIHAKNECHIKAWERPERGPYMPVYAKGPGEDAQCTIEPLTEAEKSQRYRKKARKDGSWQHRLVRERAKYWADRAKEKGDPLINALFGRTQS